MTSPHRTRRARKRARLILVGLAVCSTSLVTSQAGANVPNQGGINSSGGLAPYAQGEPAYDAPRPAGVGTGRKIG